MTIAPSAAASATEGLLASLDPEQRAAATLPDGPAQIIAPAGSGKTTTLIARLGVLLGSGVVADRIGVVTFNRDAAAELSARFASRLAPHVPGAVAIEVLTVVGVGLALGEKALQPGAAAEGGWLGELAVFGSALTGAACSVLYGPYLRRYPTLPVSAIAMLAAIGFLAVLAAGEGFFEGLPRFTVGGWLAVLFVGVSSGVGYFLWLWALSRGTPTRVTVFLALSPVSAAVLACSSWARA